MPTTLCVDDSRKKGVSSNRPGEYLKYIPSEIVSQLDWNKPTVESKTRKVEITV